VYLNYSSLLCIFDGCFFSNFDFILSVLARGLAEKSIALRKFSDFFFDK